MDLIKKNKVKIKKKQLFFKWNSLVKLKLNEILKKNVKLYL
jgi:hypothetical protein